MADIPLKALQAQLAFTRGFPLVQKFVPLDLDGSIHDCTGGTVAVTLTSQQQQYNAPTPTLNPATVLGDATGISLLFSATDTDTVIAAFGPGVNGTYIAVLTDGADSGNMCYGNWSVQNTVTP